MRRRTVLSGLSALTTLTLAGGVGGAWAEDKGYAVGDLAVGRDDAPVTVYEYASMTCPHCARFHSDTYPKLKEKYIDTGQVRMVMREFPFNGLALRASMLVRCGGPKKALGLLDILFQQQGQWSQAQDPMLALAKIGKLAGISQARFDACMADEELADSIIATRLQGQEEFDVNSTPSFVIDGNKYAGNMSLEEFEKILQDYLP